MNARILNLDGALSLYFLLKDYLPKQSSDTTVVAFISDIVSAMKVDFIGSKKFFDACLLLSGSTPIELMKLDGLSVIELFAEGLLQNQILSLIDFTSQLVENGN